MAAILDALFGSILKVITKGWPQGCPSKFSPFKVPGTDEEIQRCKADLPPGYGLVRDNIDPEGNPEYEIYVKPRIYAEDMNIASGRNCPAGTFPYDGRCWRACPKYFERQLVQQAAVKPGEEGAAGSEEAKHPVYRCIAECNNDWHPLNWVALGDERLEQRMARDDTTCYHKPIPYTDMGPEGDDKTLASEAVDVPFNMEIVAMPMVPNQPNVLYKEGKLDTGPRIFEQPGLYAARRRMSLGPAVLAAPCTSPNQITINGRCVKPCPAGTTLIGDNCVKTGLTCPVNTIEDPETKAFCRPVIKEMPMGPSILTIIASLGAVSVVGGLAIRALRRPRD